MSEWQPIETIPSDGEYVLAGWTQNSTRDTEFPRMAVGRMIGCAFWATAGWAGSTAADLPTHWMKLPAPPEEKG